MSNIPLHFVQSLLCDLNPRYSIELQLNSSLLSLTAVSVNKQECNRVYINFCVLSSIVFLCETTVQQRRKEAAQRKAEAKCEHAAGSLTQTEWETAQRFLSPDAASQTKPLLIKDIYFKFQWKSLSQVYSLIGEQIDNR